MTNGAKLIELRDRQGELIISFFVVEKPFAGKPGEEKTNPDSKGGKGNKNNDSMMTDAQKRYLFRLVADQGIEGDAAHDHLKKLFGVDSLKEVTKQEASQAIERLLEESKAGVE